MSAIDRYIEVANKLARLNRHFIERIEALKSTHIALMYTTDTGYSPGAGSVFLGAYTDLEHAQARCERKAGAALIWLHGEPNLSMWNAADAMGNAYVIIQTGVNADYEDTDLLPTVREDAATRGAGVQP